MTGIRNRAHNTIVQAACRTWTFFVAVRAMPTMPARTRERIVRLIRYRMSIRDTSAILSGFAPGNLASKAGQFLAVHHFIVNHAHQQLLDGAAVQLVDHTPKDRCGDVASRLDARVDVGPALNTMLHVTFIFQPLENGAGGG